MDEFKEECGSSVSIPRPVARLYLWMARRLYNEFAWLYDPVSWLVSGGRWSRWRRLALDYVVGPRVLEIGFGTGELLMEMVGRGLDVYGLELSRAMQRITARKMRQRDIWAPRVRGRTQTLPLADGCFNTVVATFPAEYIIDPATLCELARVLCRPDGQLVVVGLRVYRAPAFCLAPWPGSPPRDRFVERFQDMAEAAGLAVVFSSRYDPPMRLPVVVARRLS
jgi:SAM-dependent methyltransferase